MLVCELCRREVDEISKHFLRSYPRPQNKKNKKGSKRHGAKGRPVHLCRPCHHQVDRLTNKEAEHYF